MARRFKNLKVAARDQIMNLISSQYKLYIVNIFKETYKVR